MLMRMLRRIPVLLVPLCSMVSSTANAHAPGVDMGAFGTAVVDGVRSPGEWDQAAVVDYGQYTFYVMNDGQNLYMALRIDSPALEFSSLGLELDNDHNGAFFEPGDDSLVVNTVPGFFDEFRTGDDVFFDTDVAGGTTDGAGAIGNDGQSSFYEMSHPLDSADDAHDFSLHTGDTVGFVATLTVCNPFCSSFFVPAESMGTAPGGDIRIVSLVTAPPTVTASPSCLWPPNHKLVPVDVSFTLPDPWAGATVELVSVTSSDPDEGRHGGPDIQGANLGTADTSLLLRAEGDGGGTRVYTLTYRVTASAIPPSMGLGR
jgi:hypothetical protein